MSFFEVPSHAWTTDFTDKCYYEIPQNKFKRSLLRCDDLIFMFDRFNRTDNVECVAHVCLTKHSTCQDETHMHIHASVGS